MRLRTGAAAAAAAAAASAGASAAAAAALWPLPLPPLSLSAPSLLIGAHSNRTQVRSPPRRGLHATVAPASSASFSAALAAAAATAAGSAPAAALAADRAWLAQQLDGWAPPNEDAALNGSDAADWSADGGRQSSTSRRRPRPQRKARPPLPPPLPSHSHLPVAAAAAPLPTVAVPEEIMHGPLPDSFAELMRILAPFNEPRTRFALLERCLTQWSQCGPEAQSQLAGAPPRWDDCVRTLAQMRLAALSAELSRGGSAGAGTSDASNSAAASDVGPAVAPPAVLSQRHFIMVFQSLLSACMSPDRRRHVRFPPEMCAAEFDGPLLSYCIGTVRDGDTTQLPQQDDATSAAPFSSTTDAPGGLSASPSIRRPFVPDFRFYSRLLARIQSSMHVRDPAFNVPTTADRARIDPQGDTAWLLMLALEDTRRPEVHAAHVASASGAGAPEEGLSLLEADTIGESGTTANAAEADGIEDVDLEDEAEGVAHSPLPPLSLVRHLWSCLVASEVPPSLHCFNMVLAISEEHGRTESARRGAAHGLRRAAEAELELDVLDHSHSDAAGAGAEQLDAEADAADAAGDDTAGAGAGAGDARPPTPRHLRATDEHLEFIWSLWVEAERVHAVHPDTLSRVLVLRICHRHRHYGYMSRLLTRHARDASLVGMAQPVLGGHRFTQPHLLLSALTHSSKVNMRIDSNERMEFLGDAVLDVFVREAAVTRAAAMLGVPLRPEDAIPLDADPSATGAAAGSAAASSPVHHPVDASDPTLLRSAASALPAYMLASVKGKHVSHRYLAPLSRELGLSAVFLDANRDVKNSLNGWVLQREQKRRAQQQGVPRAVRARDDHAEKDALAPGDLASLAVSAVSDHLAEDAFEACLAALFLDPPAATTAAVAAGQTREGELAHAAHPPADGIAPTPDFPASRADLSAPGTTPSALPQTQAQAQAHGMPAARAFLRSAMGGDIEKDLAAALHRFRPAGSPAEQQQQPQQQQGFDVNTNYKSQLEELVRRQYTDSEGVCHAHVLYALVGTVGAHTFRVRAVIKALPGAPARRAGAGVAQPVGRVHPPLSDAFATAAAAASAAAAAAGAGGDATPSLSAKVSLLTEQLPYLRFLADVDRMAQELEDPAGQPAAGAPRKARSLAVLRADSPVSFSIIASMLPPLHPHHDRQFRSVQVRPVIQAAEQMAAFFALKEMGVVLERGGAAAVKAAQQEEQRIRQARLASHAARQAAETGALAQDGGAAVAPSAADESTDPIPFPFTTRASYDSLLSLLSDLTGHRFRNPLLVRALLFHSSGGGGGCTGGGGAHALHSYLSYLGSGLARFYVSHTSYARYSHYEEGFLTRLKDFLTAKLASDAHLMAGEMWPKLGAIMRAVSEAKEQWKVLQQQQTEEEGQEAVAAGATPSLHGRAAATIDLHPLAFPSDLFDALLAALYLDGGWAASDRFASRTLGPRLTQLHRMIAHEFPDADLGARSYKKQLQSLVQRHYGVTPLYEVCMRGGDRRWAMRVVISHSAVEAPLPLPPGAAHGEDLASPASPASKLMVFKTFWGTKLLAEQRAARHAYLALTQMLQQRSMGDTAPSASTSAASAGDGDVAAADAPDADSTRWRPEQLRSVLHACEAQMRSAAAASSTDTSEEEADAASATLRAELHQLVQRLLSPACKGVAYPAPAPAMAPASPATNFDLGAAEERGPAARAAAAASAATALQPAADEEQDHVDPFEQALASLPGSAGASGGSALGGRWLLSDYTLLLELLHSQRMWSCFPQLWPLLLDVQLILSPCSAAWLVDAFGACGSMSLIIQCLRRVRGQERFAPDRALYERVMLRCAQANPVWAWQQLHKMLDELDAHHIRPSTHTFNTALYMCARGLACSGSNQQALQAKHNPRGRGMMARAQAAAPTAEVDGADIGDGIALADLAVNGAGASTSAASPSPMWDGRTNPNQAPVSPALIVKSADRARVRMLHQHGGAVAADALTVALLAVLDTYAGRVDEALAAVEELQRRVDAAAMAAGTDATPPPPLPEVVAARAWVAELRGEDEEQSSEDGHSDRLRSHSSTPPSFSALPFDMTPSRAKFLPKHFDTYCDQAQPLLDAAIALAPLALAQHAQNAGT